MPLNIDVLRDKAGAVRTEQHRKDSKKAHKIAARALRRFEKELKKSARRGRLIAYFSLPLQERIQTEAAELVAAGLKARGASELHVQLVTHPRAIAVSASEDSLYYSGKCFAHASTCMRKPQ